MEPKMKRRKKICTITGTSLAVFYTGLAPSRVRNEISNENTSVDVVEDRKIVYKVDRTDKKVKDPGDSQVIENDGSDLATGLATLESPTIIEEKLMNHKTR